MNMNSGTRAICAVGFNRYAWVYEDGVAVWTGPKKSTPVYRTQFFLSLFRG